MNNMKRIILTGMFFLFFTSFLSLNAQWAITYGGSYNDYVDSIQQTDDGGYIVAGRTSSFGAGAYDIWILKLSSSGEIEWQRTYGGSGHDSADSIQETDDGGYIVIGEIDSFGAEVDDIWILKLSSSGDIEWQRAYGGSESEEAHSIQQTIDGGYIVRGSIKSFEEGQWYQDIWILKLSSDGGVEWQKTYGGDKSDSASSIQQTDDGGYIIVGETGSFGAGNSDIWILKFSSDGDIEWQKTYGGDKGDSASFIQQGDDGGYIVVGQTTSFGAGESDTLILKLSSDGEIEWQRTYGGSGHDSADSIQQTDDGGYIIAGSISNYPEWGGESEQNIWVLKISSIGAIEWQRSYGGSDYDFHHSIQQTSDGGYIVAGEAYFDDNAQCDDSNFLILKLSSTGDIEWQKTYGGDYSEDVASFIHQTSDEGYLVVGRTNSFGAGWADIWILKLLPNGDINPLCAFIKSSNAEVFDTDIMLEDTDIMPEDTNITPVDTDITPLDTDITPQDSSANVCNLCSEEYTLILSDSSGGTTDPTPGSRTYATGTEVSLKAFPNSGSSFSYWSGNIDCNKNPITITMDGDKSITASFYIPSEGGEWGGGGDPAPRTGYCFIATAAHGSAIHPYVRILRDFRDTYLIHNRLGCAFIKIYYTYSPFVADFITKHKALKVVVRISLLPFIAFSFILLYLGPAITAALLIFIFGLPFFLFWCQKRKLKYK
jgi:hypothetical protein